MKKKFLSITIALIISINFSITVSACNETTYYTTRILFGDSADKYEPDTKLKMLEDAMFICSEQYNSSGEQQLNRLKNNKVSRVPALSKINIAEKYIMPCFHNSWSSKYSGDKKIQSVQNNRKELLKRTVDKVFGFGMFSGKTDKREGFTELVYYSHILTDYLTNDPADSELTLKGKNISSYSGKTYQIINGNKPSFTSDEKKKKESFIKLSNLDSKGRSGVAFANIGSDILAPADSRQSIGMIKPTGWSQAKYEGIVNSNPPYIYNRCHLIAHQLIGDDTELNLITGTKYLNEGMIPFETKVAKYVAETGNHVLYRATPVFIGDNSLASGIQLEAYSVEDKGEGICFNIYLYNVQPGIQLNYVNGESSISDSTIGETDMLPFSVLNPSDSNPDLIYEVQKTLEKLFKEQLTTSTYTSLKNEIDEIAREARGIGAAESLSGSDYIKLSKCKYEYAEILEKYVPLLLKKEKFFNSVFK